MPISVACPSCRRPLTFADADAGRVAQCPCGQQMTLPATPTAAPPPRARATHAPPRPVARPGGAGAGAIVAVVLVILAAVGGLIVFNRQKAESAAARREAELEAARAAKEREEKDTRWVMVRWSVDESVLPPELRRGAEATLHVGIRLSIANKGYDRVRVDPASFRLMAEGAPYGTVLPGALEELPFGTVETGGKIEGGLVFRVLESSKSFSLECRPLEPVDGEVRYGEAR